MRLATLVAGIVAVVIAAVVLIGVGMVLLRLQAAGFTTGEALGHVSPEEILAVGGSNMALITLAGGGAIGLAWWIGRCGTKLGHAVAATALATGGILVAIALFDGPEQATRWRAAGITGGAAGIALAVALTTTDNVVHRWLKGHGWKVGAVGVALGTVAFGIALFEGERVAAGLIVAGGLGLRLALIPEKPRRRGLRRVAQWLGSCMRALAGPVGVGLLAFVLGLMMETLAMVVLVILAGVLIATLMRALPKGRELRPYALRVFVAVQVFGFALIALHAWVEPRFRPVAVLLVDGKEVSGFLLSDAPGSVHVVDVERCHRDRHDLVLKPGRARRGTATVTGVAVTSLRDLRIGDPMSMNEALDEAPLLLNELRAKAALRPHAPRHACADEGIVDLRARADLLLPPRRARELAARYRPVLHFDSREPWRPVNVDHLLTERVDGLPQHQACRAPWACDPLADVAQLRDRKVRYIDFGGTRLGGEDVRAPELEQCGDQWAGLLDCDRGPRSAIYYRAVSANDRVYVDYWWFLRYNRFRRWNAAELCSNRMFEAVDEEVPCGDHEGDWEGVTAITAADDPERLEYVSYAAHEFTVRHPAGSGRPDVYVAEGSHAAYAKACPRSCEQLASLFVVQRPETNTDGGREWGRNDDAECGDTCLLPLPDGGWSTFEGAWGSETCEAPGRACRLGHGPDSPSQQGRFQFPWCHASPGAGKLECDEPPVASSGLVE